MAKGESKVIMRHGRVYGIANLINRGAGLILLPVYTHVLTPAEFGLYASIVIVTDILSVILGMGLGRALVRLHVEQQDEAGRGAVLGTALAAYAGMSLLIALLAYPASLIASRHLFGLEGETWVFAWAILGLIPSTLFNLQLNYIIVLKRSGFYLFISIVKAVLLTALSLWLVVLLNKGVFGIVIATLIGSTAVSLIILIDMYRTTSMSLSRPILAELLRFGSPLVPTIMLDTIQSSLDRYVIGSLQGSSALGNYGLGLRITSLLNLFVTAPFMQIWGVRQLEVLQAGDENRELPQIFFRFMLTLIGLSVGISIFSDEVIRLIASEAYAPAASVLPWLACVQVLAALRSYGELGLHYAKKTSPLIGISLTSLLIGAPIYWIVALKFGIVAIASVCAGVMLVRTGLTLLWADRHSSLVRMFPWYSFTAATAVAAVCVTGTFLLPADANLLEILAAKIGILMAFFAAALALLWRAERASWDSSALSSRWWWAGRRIEREV
ncbi:Membrane protein involved in the export of O-antigen and teichoic acid [Microvirga guangxiensis]|uniref:Membrane protein involved in the export of O-antigen and teichoic acid n=2 Tax=Microvirga guangxiensis TaxID=549386 RepID=A0A1G5GZM5_9HYPH|nr:Membrane protein involved in the export of O-antigen and teichoic acid [Microvirga guangxiensis]